MSEVVSGVGVMLTNFECAKLLVSQCESESVCVVCITICEGRVAKRLTDCGCRETEKLGSGGGVHGGREKATCTTIPQASFKGSHWPV